MIDTATTDTTPTPTLDTDGTPTSRDVAFAHYLIETFKRASYEKPGWITDLTDLLLEKPAGLTDAMYVVVLGILVRANADAIEANMRREFVRDLQASTGDQPAPTPPVQ